MSTATIINASTLPTTCDHGTIKSTTTDVSAWTDPQASMTILIANQAGQPLQGRAIHVYAAFDAANNTSIDVVAPSGFVTVPLRASPNLSYQVTSIQFPITNKYFYTWVDIPENIMIGGVAPKITITLTSNACCPPA